MAFASFSPMFRPTRRAFIAAILFPCSSAAMAAAGSVAASLAFWLSVPIRLNPRRRFRADDENVWNADATGSGVGTYGLDGAPVPARQKVPRVKPAPGVCARGSLAQ